VLEGIGHTSVGSRHPTRRVEGEEGPRVARGHLLPVVAEARGVSLTLKSTRSAPRFIGMSLASRASPRSWLSWLKCRYWGTE